MHTFYRKLRTTIYWGLPVIIFYFIFKQMDFVRLLELGKSANPWLIGLGICLTLPKMLAGALRWHLLARGYDCTRLRLGQSFREYWCSLALGAFTPGSLGSDVYRVALGGHQTGRYFKSAFVIIVEKGAALLSCVALIAGVYPFLTFERLSAEFEAAVDVAYAAALLGLVLLVFLALTHKIPWLGRLGTKLWRRAGRLATEAVNLLPGQSVLWNASSIQPGELIRPLFSPRIAMPTVALSIAIHVIGATQGQIFLQALGYDLPFLANLFIAPLNILVLTLPITVGGVGVREGAYILFYGAFGVPTETALMVSFCFLFSVMLVQAIGGILYLGRKRSSRIT